MAKKVAYRKRHQNRFSMFLVSLIVVMIMLVVMEKSSQLRQKITEVAVRNELISEQIDAEKVRADEIAEYGKYVQTKGFYEEVAKDKLGLMYPGEILFKED